MVKILDGRLVNGYFWVLYAGLTDARVGLTVTEMRTGKSKSYTTNLGTFASKEDTRAFRSSAGTAGTDQRTMTIDRLAFAGDWGTEPAPAEDFVANFTYLPAEPVTRQAITFIDRSSGSPDQWCWTFGDEADSGCSAENPVAVHTYTNAGTYRVTLFVGRPSGPSQEVATVEKSITVSACSFALSSTTEMFEAGGGSGAVSLSASSLGCAWTAESRASFLHLTSAGSGSGSAKVAFKVDPNDTGATRQGSLIIAQRTFTVTQRAFPCTFEINPIVGPLNPAGWIGALFVQTQSACTWKATTSDLFIAFPAAVSGKGPGNVQYCVAANRGQDRAGTIAIADRKVGIKQLGFDLPVSCQETPTSLCLLENRFEVRVAFRGPTVTTDVGRSTRLNQSAGYFAFIDPTDLEILLKMIDGRPSNGHFWLFYGAMSNAAYVITATDTVSGETSFYCNPVGTFRSLGDTLAFPRP